MAATLQSIRNRIRSIENTKKMTAAMQLISAVKLSQTERLLAKTAVYRQRLEEMVAHLIVAAEGSGNRFLSPNRGGKLCLCVIVSDSGLCGSYNYNILETARRFIKEQGQENVFVVAIGKKAEAFFRKEGVVVEKGFYDFHGRYKGEKCQEICHYLSSLYTEGRAKAIHVVYTRFGSKFLHKASVVKFLNLEFEPQLGPRHSEFLFEPNATWVLDELLPRYILAKFQRMLVEAFAGEHAARAMAMKSSTDNAKELLEFLVLTRNKVRQANVTRAIIEIASSVEALGR
jgi:F-type H+-transporting ATPase subunit gamma